MLDLLRHLFSRPGALRTVILLEPDTMSTPRQYDVRPSLAFYAAVIGTVGLGALLVALIILTPLRRVLAGPSAGELRSTAEQSAQRAEALEDSVRAQYQQITQLRAIITGDVDGLDDEMLDPAAIEMPELGDVPARQAPPAASAEAPARGDAIPLDALRARGEGPAPGTAAAAYLAGLRLPALPPLDGVLTRGYSAESGHFGIDIAAEEGTPVRAIGEGYVVFADWTHAGGWTVAVQHAGGYLSVYKHNQRVTARAGDRVGARETIALSGDTGEVTSGPHLHLEVWRNGLAQDPAAFLLLPSRRAA